ncbi:MAG: RHS repeat-associated core domain-containing protein, partial [Bacteroidetes Order II. Incertae sedis bacterium]|nr:RHS repeat-associated core domain-containing protein [Bacteroidetes Order II. bacterium]
LQWYHYGVRWYDPQLSRWHTIDPAEEFHTPYAYVGNDPVNLVDPDGAQTWTVTQNDNERSYRWCGTCDPTASNAIKPGTVVHNISIAVPSGERTGKSSLTFLDHGKTAPYFPDHTAQLNTIAGVVEAIAWAMVTVGNPPLSGGFGGGLVKSTRVLSSSRALSAGPRLASRGSQVAAGATKTGGNLWKVGAYNELQGLEAGLQAHHVGQKSLMSKLVPGNSPANAPSILVPEIGHVDIVPFSRTQS